MKITRHTDAVFLNKVVNDPSIIEHVRGHHKGYLDMSPVLANPHFYILMGEHGGCLVCQHQPGFYEVHTSVLPAGRGKWTLEMVQAVLEYMFCRTDAVELVSRVPKGNLGARALVRAIHADLDFRHPRGWTFNDQEVYADIYSLTIQKWLRTAEGLTEKGEWFHNKLEQEYAKIGKKVNHDDDPGHDRYVGAAVMMAMVGNPNKGCVFYNKWAAMSGYLPIGVFSENPVVIDIQEALILVRNNDFWVMNHKG